MAQENNEKNKDRDIEVSIIVPFKSFLSSDFEPCLKSLLNQDFKDHFEIILIEGGNIAQARNHGIKKSNGEYIALIDSDCLAPKDWLTVHISQIKEKNDSVVIGAPGVAPKSESLLSNAIDSVYQTTLGSLGSPSLTKTNNLKQVKAISSHNSIFNGDDLREIGGFNEKYLLNEDTELSLRLREQGHKLYFSPIPIVTHKRKTRIIDFFKKFYQWGLSRARAGLTNTKLIDYRIAAVYAAIPLSMLAGYWKPLIPVTVLTIYFTILVLYGIITSIKKRDSRFLYLIPILFIFQHAGYALGLTIGILKGPYRKITDDPIIREIIYKKP